MAHSLQKSASQSAEIRVFWVIDLNDTPWIDSSPNGLAIKFDLLLRTHDSKRKKSTKLAVVLNRLFIVLLHIIGEVVHGDVIVLDILHDLHPNLNIQRMVSWVCAHPLLETTQLAWSQRISFANNGDDVYAG